MTSAIRPPRRLAWLGRACLVAAAAVTVAGCVSMPDNGPMGAISASPQSTTAGGDFIEPVPSGPTPSEAPAAIVNGFLAASASFPVHDTIAREYLVSSASKTWSPGWSVTVFSSSHVSQQSRRSHPSTGGRAVVDFSADVQSTFDGTGQFVSALTKQSKTKTYPFQLVQVDGQWRIANPPSFRLLTATQFTEFYQARDLYFVNPYLPASSPLVPASVFVPQGTSTADLVTKLVNALLPDAAGQPNSTWLQTAADTFPAGTRLGGVTLDNTTAVVSLHGPANASKAMLEQVSAQLTWTLASPRAGPPAAIQSVELVWDGQAFIPPEMICGSSQTRSPVQNQDIYPCYNPYPSQPSEFFFTSDGQVWSRCGSEDSAQRGQVGRVVSVFHSTGISQPCSRGSVPTSSTTAPASAPLPVKDGAAAIVAVSLDGADVAYYSPATKDVFIRLSASGGLRQVSAGPDVTALSWDRSHDLWIAQNGDVFMVPPAGAPIQATTDLPDVTALSIAPDGVRVALVEQGAAGPEVELAAVAHGGLSSPGQHGSPLETASINGPVQVGPDIAQPDTLTWYDADDLIVLAGSSAKATLSEVPVDGQNSSSSQPAPAGANAITAAGGMNALVAGLSDHQLAVSTGLEGPWQPLAVPGQNPAYPG